MSSDFEWYICDSKNRILFGRKLNSDQIIFARYVDMTDEDLDTVLTAYAASIEIPEDVDIYQDDRIKKMLNYMKFKEDEDDFCG